MPCSLLSMGLSLVAAAFFPSRHSLPLCCAESLTQNTGLQGDQVQEQWAMHWPGSRVPAGSRGLVSKVGHLVEYQTQPLS